MCRQFAAPPGMKRGDILDILLDNEGSKTGDGFGLGYVKNGKFLVKKTVMPLSEILKKKSKDEFFGDCFKNDGWTLYHSRKASSNSDIKHNNCHPFIGDNNVFCHNGYFSDAPLVRAALNDNIKYSSTTDSEVALKFYEKVGPKRFLELMDNSGVYFALNKNGNLTAIKTNLASDLKIAKLNKTQYFLSSSLVHDCPYENDEMEPGIAVFNPKGELISQKDKENKNYTQDYKGYKTYKDYNNQGYFGQGYNPHVPNRTTIVWNGNKKTEITRGATKFDKMTLEEYNKFKDGDHPYSYGGDY